MPLPITIPNTFANATATIPLSQLDNNFSTVAVAVNSIGNGAFTLANVQVTGGKIANVVLDNVSVDVETLSNVTITNLTVNGNATFTNAAVTANVATITTANVTTANVASFISSNVSITGGSLDNVTIGSATAAAANVTNLTVNGNTTLGDANTDTILMTAAPSIGGAGLGMGFGFRNRIINGAMVIDQRNAGASVTVNTASNQYSLDRWKVEGQATDGVYTAQQDTSVPTGFDKSLKITVTTADASIGSTQRYQVIQNLEGYNVADLGFGAAGAKTTTVSFWVRSSLTGTFGGSYRNSAANRSYPFSYTISVADTWEYKTVTIAGDTSGTWLKDNNAGITLTFSMGSGTNFQGTAGAWNSNNNNTVTGETQLIGTLNATWYVTGVQLEKGSTATSFDYRPYGTELALCQRYFQLYQAAGAQDTVSMGNAENTTRGYFLLSLPVSMRTAPACTLTATNFSMRGTTVNVACTSGSLGGNGGLSNSFIAGEFNCGSAHGAPAGGCVKLTANTTASTIQISSEL